MGSPYGIDLRKKVMLLLKKRMSKSQVSALLHISIARIARWKKRLKEGKSLESVRAKSFIKKIDPKIVEAYIKEHSSATYEEMARALGFSKTAIRDRVEQLGITLKKSHSTFKAKKEEREAFRRRINQIEASTIVYIDESEVDHKLYRSHGRAKRGVKIYEGMI